jgi:hypothetical protein
MTIPIPSKTPYEIWFGKKPNLSHLRIFGTFAHVHIPKELKQKLDIRFKKYMNVWYVEEIKGYRVYIDPKIHNIFLNRGAIFVKSTVLGEILDLKQP